MSAAKKVARRSTLVVTTVLVATVLIAAPAFATAVTPLSVTAFSNPTLPDTWVAPTPQSGTNVACLTASADATQTPVKGCALGSPDADGSGVLRLTPTANTNVGTVFYNLSLPTSQGIDLTFNSYQYNGSGADGIAFMLAASDPANPTAPAATGPAGGSLGYSAVSGSNGLPYGYLGLGLDVYGNYTNTVFSGTGCATPSGITASTLYPQQITARGPGNGGIGYCILSSTAQTGGIGAGKRLDDPVATSRAGLAVPVEVAINPSASPITTTSGLSVPASSYVVAATPISGTQKMLTGALPTTTNNALMASTFPSSWINPSTGIPYQLTLGWAASTGGSNETHEIAALNSTTLAGQLPVYSLDAQMNHSGGLPDGQSTSYRITPKLSSTEGSESSPVTVTTTFPSGVTPGSATGTGWSCSTAGQVVTCTQTPGSAIAAGAYLPSIDVPVDVASGASGTKTVTAKVSSLDGLPAITQVSSDVVHLPSVPTNVASSVSGGSATVTWSPPVSDGGAAVTVYTVRAIPPGGVGAVTNNVSGSARSTTFYGLDPGTAYTFEVRASNAVGFSPAGTSGPGTTSSQGYWTVGVDGGVFAYGAAPFKGSATDLHLNQPIVGMVPTPDRGGYWLAGADGGVFSYGNANFYGSAVNAQNHAKVIGIASAPDGQGYWLAFADGSVTPYGSASASYGSAAGTALTSPVVLFAATPSGAGYWLVTAKGDVYAYGDAHSFGQASSLSLRAPIVGITPMPTGNGYWLVGADGGVFAYGDANYCGNALDIHLKGAVVGMAPTPSGKGYWLTGADGGVFAYGDAHFYGSMGGKALKGPMTFISAY